MRKNLEVFQDGQDRHVKVMGVYTEDMLIFVLISAISLQTYASISKKEEYKNRNFGMLYTDQRIVRREAMLIVLVLHYKWLVQTNQNRRS